MSLGTHTKCDLSAGVAKLDLVTLTAQIEIHYYGLLDKMRKKISEAQYDNQTIEARRDSVSSMSSTGADDVMRIAKNLAETTELLHTLQETSNREIEIIR